MIEEFEEPTPEPVIARGFSECEACYEWITPGSEIAEDDWGSWVHVECAE